VAGKYVGLFNEAGDQIDLTLYAQAEEVSSRRDLAAVQLVTPTGQSVRLDSVADVQTTTGPTAINHVEKERAITLTVNLTDAVPLERAIGAIEREILSPLRQVLPKSYSLRLGGTADKLNSTLRALTGSFYLAVVIVYLLMVALFRSWVYPLIIMVTIPMAMTGAFLGIAFAHGVSGGLVTFDVIAMLGLIILAGIVVNNAILIVHQTLNLRERGLLPDEALREAARSRLRPICMSVGTSVLAMLPLALGRGAGTELYRGLGAVMIGGLVVSTIFTLFLVPALFSLAQDIQAVLGRRHGDS
jgi:HAE1 family hydrophobic/amphiphilic exporter-1